MKKALRIILVVITVILFLVTLVINFFPSDYGKAIGLFLNSTGGIARVYELEITPASWAFSIWGLIYLFQAVMLIYIIANIFRRTVYNTRLLFDPNYITSLFIGIYGCNFIFNSSWIIIFDRSVAHVVLLSVASCILWLTLGVLIAAVTISYIELNRNISTLLDYGLKGDIWAVRILIHNGVSLYAAWGAVASPLNTAIALTYVHHVSNENSSTIALALLALEIVIYVSLDTFVLDRWTRYTISPHLVLVWALTAAFTKNYVPGKRNSIFIAVLLALAIAALVKKIILLIVRHIKFPPSQDTYSLRRD